MSRGQHVGRGQGRAEVGGEGWGGYSHDAVATARALGQPLQAAQRGAQLAGGGFEVPRAARPRPLP